MKMHPLFKLRLSIILFCITGITISLSSQSLVLEKGKRNKIIKPGKYIKVKFTKKNKQEDCDYCFSSEVWGTLVKVEDELVTVKVDMYIDIKKEEDFDLRTNVRYKSNFKDVDIPIEEIFHITYVGSEKYDKRRGDVQTVAGITLFAGVLTLGHSLVLSDNKSRGQLALFGVYEIAAGIVGLIVFKGRDYNLHIDENHPWKIVP